MNIPIVTTKAYCSDCHTHVDPDDLVQSWTARDELACPDCRTAIPDQFIPNHKG